MEHKLFTLRSSQSVVGPVIIFLLFSFSMHAMKCIITDCSDGISLTNDLFITTVCSRLDRPMRDSFRRTNKKYFKLLLSQDELNKNYEEACDTKDDLKMAYWKSLGGCFAYQEFADAVKSKKYKLATWLMNKKKVVVWDAYCSNIKQAVETSTVDEMVPVIECLLYSRKPTTYNSEYLSGYYVSNQLKEQYPEAQKFIDLFQKYTQEQAKFEEIAKLGEAIAQLLRNNARSSCECSCQARCGYY